LSTRYALAGACLLGSILPVQVASEVQPDIISGTAPVPCKQSAAQASIQLLPADFQGLSVEQALQQRHSERRFGKQPLSMAQLSQLLWAAQGITRSSGQRTAPSSARSYPIDLYVSLQKVAGGHCGLYRYEPAQHRLTRLAAADYGAALTAAAEGQPWVGKAAIVVLHVATPARAAKKYGAATAMPSALIESGHISQNLYLQATSLGLAVLGMNGFSAPQMDALLGLDSAQTTLFINLVGARAN
jgi:SagB-type dehydrogenase family enzyme